MSGMYDVTLAFGQAPWGDYIVTLKAAVTDPAHRMFHHKLEVVVHRGAIAPVVTLSLELTFDLVEPLIATVDIVVGDERKIIDVTIDDAANKFNVQARNLGAYRGPV